MKWNMVFAALVVSVGLGGQSFGFELLDRMLGLNSYGGSCCQPSCCEQSCAAEPSCCAAPEPTCCEPEPTCCEPEPTCCEAAPCCRKARCHDLFGGLKGLFACHKCAKKSCCEAAPSCCEAEPTCCEAEPTCCEAPAPCCKKRCHRGLLHHIFAHKRCCKKSSCCETACSTGCSSGCSSCDAGAAHSDAIAPTPAGEGDAAPAPPAPVADPSASLRSHQIFQASKYVRTR